MQKIYRNFSFPISFILCLVIGVVSIRGQTLEAFKIDLGIGFGRISAPEIEKDEGNELIAIRRMVFLFEDLGLQRKPKKMVEIQLKAKKILIGGANCCEVYGFINGRSFPVYRAGDYHLIRMEKADFDELKEGSIIFLAYIAPGMIQFLAEKSKNNDLGQQSGERFGRLKKKDINRFPEIKEDQDGFNERLRQISKGNINQIK